jgi:pyruvate kinase
MADAGGGSAAGDRIAVDGGSGRGGVGRTAHRNAKIVCTLGPASADRETIRDLSAAGMSVARINASHGDRDDRRDLIERIRGVDRESERPLATMLDLQGPEIRTATIDHEVQLETGSTIRFVEGDEASATEVGLTVDITPVEPGDRVLLDDGRIETVVEGVADGGVEARVEVGGELGSRRGVNVPGVDLGIQPVTERDRKDLTLAAEEAVDFVAASFVRGPKDVRAVEGVLAEHGGEVPVIAKVERADAVANAEQIVKAAYGVMVARGDLGVECPMEEVPVIQKRLIRRCREAGVPVITATEMLDSMIHERRPTRAEASDVANAVLDGTDAVMLSGETAIGDHPVSVVETMDRIIREIEGSEEYAELREQRVPTSAPSRTAAVARSARYLARDVNAAAIVVASESGYTAQRTAKYRPAMPVVASTPRDEVRRRLALSWGVTPQYAPLTEAGAYAVIENAVSSAMDAGLVESGETIVVLSGMMTELEQEGASTTNTLKVHVAAETVATGHRLVGGRVTGPYATTTDRAPDGAITVLDGPDPGSIDRFGGLLVPPGDPDESVLRRARTAGVPSIHLESPIESIERGDTVTLDANRGVVYRGAIDEGRGRRGEEHDG